MEYPTTALHKLFSDVAEKANLSLAYADSEALSEIINDYGDSKSNISIKGKFLYEAFRKIEVAIQDSRMTVKFSPTYINRLAQFLDLRSFTQYKEMFEEDHESNSQKDSRIKNLYQKAENINNIEGNVGIINNN